jgi:hypothetical protein
MQQVIRKAAVSLIFCAAFFIFPSRLSPQHVQDPIAHADDSTSFAASLPDAPTPQIELAASFDPQPVQTPASPQLPSNPAPSQNPTGQGQSAPPQQPPPGSPAPAPAGTANSNATQSGSSSQAQPQTPETQETKHQKAEEQIKEQEHQRIAGIVPSFNVSYRSDAVSLTPAEKFRLQFHSAIDPYTFSIATIVAGLGEAEDSNNGLGWGPSGFFKRAAAAYGDNVIGNTLGNALLPSILHQDPRYFRLGHGSIHHRLFYAIATSFICKHDNTGKWEPNYSNVGGNIIAGEISTLYYPNTKSDAVQAIETGMTVTLEGTFGATLQEFWPDISRRFFHKDPTHGLDAQAQAADAAAKQKKQQEKNQSPQQ